MDSRPGPDRKHTAVKVVVSAEVGAVDLEKTIIIKGKFMRLTKENFPDQIREMRKKKKWSRNDLAFNLGVSPRAVEHWEQGRPPARYLVPMINMFLEEL